MFNTFARIVLGETNLTIRDVVNLRLGDVVTLDRRIKEPVEVFVNNELKFYGKPGNFGKCKAVEILSRVATNKLEVE